QNFNELTVAYANGMPVRLSDIGHAENGIENMKVKAWLNDERAIQLAVYRQPGTNTVQVVKNIRALFPEIEREAPPGVKMNVVNDAIVVLENITRHMEMGKDRMRAALEGSKEIGFTVLSMTLSLSAVFIPILFMQGMLGRLFREFAVTVGCAVMISGVVALSM